MNDYEQKQEDRRERLRRAAERAEQDAKARRSNVDRLARVMNGQPILIGHHSERRHRRHIERMDNDMRRSVESSKRAEELRYRADAVGTGGISSDDPEAVEKISSRIERLEAQQQKMKEANRVIRRKPKNQPTPEKIAELTPMVGALMAQQLFRPDFCGRVGFADYLLSNNNANIRRLKQRLASLKCRSTEVTERKTDVCRVVENGEENRLQLFFDGKPPDEWRNRLKRAGFRWSRFNGCWQRHLNNGARAAADYVIASIQKVPK